jgi:hypothetical protein
MKQLFLRIYYYFANFRKAQTFKGFEKKLQGALVNKAQNQIELIKEIKAEIDLLWPKSRSKYIPLSIPQRNEIRAKVYTKFGKQMSSLKIHINSNLQFT